MRNKNRIFGIFIITILFSLLINSYTTYKLNTKYNLSNGYASSLRDIDTIYASQYNDGLFEKDLTKMGFKHVGVRTYERAVSSTLCESVKVSNYITYTVSDTCYNVMLADVIRDIDNNNVDIYYNVSSESSIAILRRTYEEKVEIDTFDFDDQAYKFGNKKKSPEQIKRFNSYYSKFLKEFNSRIF